MKIKLYRFMGLSLLLLAGILVLSGCRTAANKTNKLVQKDSFALAEPNQIPAIRVAQANSEVGLDDLKLAGVKVYDPEERVKSVLGKPDKTENLLLDDTDKEGKRIFYHGLVIEVLKKTGVSRITTDSAQYETARGLKVGDSIEKVYQLYGERELDENREIHYTFGKDDFDVFMVKVEDGKVCLISVYLTC